MKKTILTRRILAMLLLLAMVLGVFSGCQNQAPQAEVPTRDDSETTGPVRDEQSDGILNLDQELTQNQRLEPVTSRAPGNNQKKRNTVLVYMVGSDLESNYGCASSDIMEMMNAGINPEYTNLVIYTGGSRAWNLNISSSYNSVLALTPDGRDLSVVATTGQAVNMGDPATLADFLCYAYDAFPAEGYSLILWDHGGGPLYGYGSDELFNYDGLYLWELQEALAATPFAKRQFDIIGFDACLMASLETAAILRPYARYMVASEEVEDGNGWDYSFLSIYNENPISDTVCKEILRTYEASMKSLRWRPEYTLSYMNLSYVRPLERELDTLFHTMALDVQNGAYSYIAQYRDNTKRFGVGCVSSLSNSYDLVDLGDMVQMLYHLYGGKATRVLNTLDGLVVDQVSNVPYTYGLSLYYPYDNKTLYQNGGAEVATYYLDCPGYVEFLQVFGSQWLSGRNDNYWSGNRTSPAQEPGKKPDYLYLQIEPEALETLSSVTYSILRYDSAIDAYYEVLTDCRVDYYDNGVAGIPMDPSVFLLGTDTVDRQQGLGQSVLWPATQVETADNTENYICDRAILMTSTAAIVGESTPVQMVFSLDKTSGEVQIQHILSRNEDADFYGKQDVDISNYSVAGFYWYALYPTYDDQGHLLPAEKWQDDGSFWISYQNYRDTIYLESKPISALDGAFYAQLHLKDTYGNVISSDLLELKGEDAYETVNLSTEAGELTFHVYQDHATLTNLTEAEYNAFDGTPGFTLEIPETVNGVPVTEIAQRAMYYCWGLERVVIPGSVRNIDHNAFAGCFRLKYVTFPEGLERIGVSAFSGTALEEASLPDSLKVLDTRAFVGTNMSQVEIPAGVVYVGEGVFGTSHSLAKIEVAAGNQYYKSIDGVLFTADGKTLVAFPCARDTYEVPEGTEEIGVEAFMGAATLESITFPETLKVIGNQAFCNTVSLTEINLPDSLERIGAAAFGVEIGTAPTDRVKNIYIGANVRSIGENAFEGYRMDSFSVSAQNLYYSEADGCLLNYTGTRLIKVPYNYQGVLNVPEGVGYLDAGALDGCDGITEIVLPDSVGSISQSVGVPENLQKITVGAGLSNWNGMYHFAAVPEIRISEENPFYQVVDGSIYNEEMTILHLCRATSGNFVIPEGVTELGENAFGAYGALGITEVQLPASLKTVYGNVFAALGELQSITVASGNSKFISYDGLLYSADGKKLLACPLGITDTVIVREGTVEIGENAFTPGYRLKAAEVRFPETVVIIRGDNFTASNYNNPITLCLPASLTDIHPGMLSYMEPGDVIIHAPAGSVAESYAVSMGHEVINKMPWE